MQRQYRSCDYLSTYGGCQFGFQESSSGKWLTTVRGKVGAVWGNWMFYGTAGLAYAKMTFTSNFADTSCSATSIVPGLPGVMGCNLASQFCVTQTKIGPVGGAGLSYMLTRNWILSVEYLYVSLDGFGGDTRAVNTTNTCAWFPQCRLRYMCEQMFRPASSGQLH